MTTDTDDVHKKLDSAIEEYLYELDRYAGSKETSAKSFAEAFLDLGLANSRGRSALDKYTIDERETTADLTVEVKEGGELALSKADGGKGKAVLASGGFSSGYASTLVRAQDEFRRAVEQALAARTAQARLDVLGARVSELQQASSK